MGLTLFLNRLMVGVLFLFCVRAAQAQPVATRPHIVVFLSDDHSWHDCGPYGAKDVRTPNMDRVARQGMRFDAAVAPSPTCTPSRSAILTGLYPFRNGAHANHSLVKEGVRSLPQYMKELGYRVVLAGKTHIGPRESFPFEYLKSSNIMPEGKSHVLWTDLNTAAVDRLLGEHDQKTPLCLVVCSHSPHVYWPSNEGYEPAAISLPPYLLDTRQTRLARCRYYTDVSWMDRQLGEVVDSMTRHGYLEKSLLVVTADQGAQWPFAKWNLYEAGIRAPLLVSWPGKVKAGSSTEALVSLVDLLPTFIEAAGGDAPEGIDGKSFLPVLLGKVQKHHERVFASHTGDGRMNRSPMRCVRTGRYKYIRNLLPEEAYRTHISEGAGEDGRSYWASWIRLAETDAAAAALAQRYRKRPAEELYDLSSDPFEQKNLSDDPAHKEVLATLRQQLEEWRVQQGEDLTKVPMPEDARKGDIRYAN